MDKFVMALAILVLGGFLAVLLLEVPRLDLGCVIAFTFLMMLYDFIFAKRPG